MLRMRGCVRCTMLSGPWGSSVGLQALGCGGGVFGVFRDDKSQGNGEGLATSWCLGRRRVSSEGGREDGIVGVCGGL